MGTDRGIICGPKIYEYHGVMFEFSYTGGPWPLKKNWEPKKRAGKKFFDLYYRFSKLSEKEQEEYRVGGGCITV